MLVTCTLAGLAACLNVPATFTLDLGTLTGMVHVTTVHTDSCLTAQVVSRRTFVGFTRNHVLVLFPVDAQNDGSVSGHGVIRFSSFDIDLTRFDWPHESDRDRLAVTAFDDAVVQHEAGHVRIAETSVVRLESGLSVIADSKAAYDELATQRGKQVIDEIQADQDRYDYQTHHGARQHVLKSALGNSDVVLRCPT